MTWEREIRAAHGKSSTQRKHRIIWASLLFSFVSSPAGVAALPAAFAIVRAQCSFDQSYHRPRKIMKGPMCPVCVVIRTDARGEREYCPAICYRNVVSCSWRWPERRVVHPGVGEKVRIYARWLTIYQSSYRYHRLPIDALTGATVVSTWNGKRNDTRLSDRGYCYRFRFPSRRYAIGYH